MRVVCYLESPHGEPLKSALLNCENEKVRFSRNSNINVKNLNLDFELNTLSIPRKKVGLK